MEPAKTLLPPVSVSEPRFAAPSPRSSCVPPATVTFAPSGMFSETGVLPPPRKVYVAVENDLLDLTWPPRRDTTRVVGYAIIAAVHLGSSCRVVHHDGSSGLGVHKERIEGAVHDERGVAGGAVQGHVGLFGLQRVVAAIAIKKRRPAIRAALQGIVVRGAADLAVAAVQREAQAHQAVECLLAGLA